MTIHAGVDLGGTWLRVCAVNGSGRVLFETSLPSHRPLPASLGLLWKKHGVRPDRLVVGARGVWKKAPRIALKRALAGMADEVIVISDVELAYLSTLGPRPGLLVLAGTGSIALARDKKGRWHRAGGAGPSKGDEGSGFWIGHEYLRRHLGKETVIRPENVRKAALLAPRVLHRAAKDALCGAIVNEAAGHLARIGLEAAGKAGLKRPMTGWHGGVMEEASFRRKVFQLLKPSRVVSPPLSAARWAAARWISG